MEWGPWPLKPAITITPVLQYSNRPGGLGNRRSLLDLAAKTDLPNALAFYPGDRLGTQRY
jgi:hypothetical protein